VTTCHEIWHARLPVERRCTQESSILEGIPCDMLQNPTSELGWEASEDALEEVILSIQEAMDMPTKGRPFVVTFCTDGSRGAMVCVHSSSLSYYIHREADSAMYFCLW
jgi:hypothetical protein